MVVLIITGIAQSAGPRYSGLLAALPNMSLVLFSFTYAQGGKPAIVAFVRGAMMSNTGYLSFLTVLSFVRMSEPITLFAVAFATAFTVAYASNLVTQQNLRLLKKAISTKRKRS